MSAISNFINTIRNAVYGEQVRGAIVSALEQCYSDVNSPSLQTEAFTAALNAAYAGGILDIQTVTQISAMTNQAIIYRYNGTQAGYQKGLYYYSALTSSWVLIGSEIHSVSNSSQMTDTNSIYKYTGTQSGMVQNSLYCYNGTAWVPIGSGVLTASTAAQMTNTDAIYKYTGSESGYYTNALYYYNGTDWTPVGNPAVTDEVLFSHVAKEALISLLENVAFVNNRGQSYIDALSLALGLDDDDDVEYELTGAFSSNGTSTLATNVALTEGKHTILCEFTVTTKPSDNTVNFVYSNRSSASQSAYLGVQVGRTVIWGNGLGYDNGIVSTDSNKYRCVSIFDLDNGTKYAKVKNVTTGATAEGSRELTAESVGADKPIVIGKNGDSIGFVGTLSSFKIVSREFTSAEIAVFLG